MDQTFRDCFIKGFGYEIPYNLSVAISLLRDAPCFARVTRTGEILEIQYLPLPSVELCDVQKNRFCFAIDSDGHKIYAKLNSPHLDLSFEHWGDDESGISINDILSAAIYK